MIAWALPDGLIIACVIQSLRVSVSHCVCQSVRGHGLIMACVSQSERGAHEAYVGLIRGANTWG